MAHRIVKLTRGTESRYLLWSTVADGPVTRGLTREELEKEIRFRDGQAGVDLLPERVARADATGCSGVGETLRDMLCVNRAGPREARLTEEQIWDRYCTGGRT